jgi:hypothetical protein
MVWSVVAVVITVPCRPVWQPPGLSGPAPGGACDGWRGHAPLRLQLVSPPRREVFCTLPRGSSASQNMVSNILCQIGSGSNWACRSGFDLGPVLRIRDVYPGSEFFSIPDPGSKRSWIPDLQKRI